MVCGLRAWMKRGCISGRGIRFSSSSRSADRLWCPPILLFNNIGSRVPAEVGGGGVKRPQRESDNSPPSSADNKNE